MIYKLTLTTSPGLPSRGATTSKMKSITVDVEGFLLSIEQVIADKMGLTQGQSITQDEALQAVTLMKRRAEILFSEQGNTNTHRKDLRQFLPGGWWHDDLPDWVQYICIDGYGEMYWFENKPAPAHYGWLRKGGKAEPGPKCNIDGHNPAELIWERPKGEI